MENIPLKNRRLIVKYNDDDKIRQLLDYFYEKEWLRNLNPTFDKVGVFRIEAIDLYKFWRKLLITSDVTESETLKELILIVRKKLIKLRSIEQLVNKNGFSRDDIDLIRFKKSLVLMLS